MFDYVIVGAGSAGCVLANRLSEDPDVSVLLLEAGPPDVQDNVHVPLGYLKLAKTDVDWDYSTAPEPFCGGRRIYLPRGKTLGGSSSINAMVYIRGNRRDYDSWGIPGWGYDDLLPYWERSPLPVSESRSKNAMAAAFVEAAVEAGHPRNDDFNGADQDGFGIYKVTQEGGMRASTAAVYLKPAMERPNLRVETYMQANRVVFDGTRAVGVEAQRLGEVHRFDAEREVILTGGTYNSPQLLMLSGVGPAEHLTMREIEVVLDFPQVGENLVDHPAVTFVYTGTEPESLLLALEPAALEEFELHQTGPFASNLAESGGFTRVLDDSEAPDIQFHAVPVQIIDEGFTDPEEHGMWLSPCLLQPRSRGSVTLAANDPTAKPLIRHNYYAAEEDMATMIAGCRQLMEIASQPALQPYAATPFTVPEGESDDDVRAHVARHTTTLYHPVGTCAMGSVVDADLRVQGLESLRVVDASVMPMVPRGNTNAPTIASAERAADLIRGLDPQRREAAPPPSAVPAA